LQNTLKQDILLPLLVYVTLHEDGRRSGSMAHNSRTWHVVEESGQCQTLVGWPLITRIRNWWVLEPRSTNPYSNNENHWALCVPVKYLDPHNCAVRSWRNYAGEISSLRLQHDSSHVSGQGLLNNVTVPTTD